MVDMTIMLDPNKAPPEGPEPRRGLSRAVAIAGIAAALGLGAILATSGGSVPTREVKPADAPATTTTFAPSGLIPEPPADAPPLLVPVAPAPQIVVMPPAPQASVTTTTRRPVGLPDD